MAGEIDKLRPPESGGTSGGTSGGERPAVHVRTVVIQPTSALGKLALTAVLVGAGVLFFTVGVAIAVGLAAAATVVGVGVVAYRAIAGRGSAPTGLDPGREVHAGEGPTARIANGKGRRRES